MPRWVARGAQNGPISVGPPRALRRKRLFSGLRRFEHSRFRPGCESVRTVAPDARPGRGPGARRNTIGCHDAPASVDQQWRLRYRVPCSSAVRRGDRLCEGQAIFTGCELSFKNASTACTRRLSLTMLGLQNQQPEDDADRRRGQNGAREQASQSQCHRCDGRPDPSSGNQPQWRPSAAGPGHDQVFQPTVDRRAEAAGHRARIRLGFLNGDDATPRPLSRASGDRSEPARPPLASGRSGAA
jgi:hypothetical protein